MLIRYVDDIFCATSNQTIFDNIFRILSSIHSSIQFSQEIEEHHLLSFRGVLLMINGMLCKHQFTEKNTHRSLYKMV